jgi:sulfate adenylyltransferase subunit 2
LLGWQEIDVREYIERENIPVVNLYFAKGGKRYRSIRCETGCEPVSSDADAIDKIIEELRTSKISERSGRSQDKEDDCMTQKLRALANGSTLQRSKLLRRTRNQERILRLQRSS